MDRTTQYLKAINNRFTSGQLVEEIEKKAKLIKKMEEGLSDYIKESGKDLDFIKISSRRRGISIECDELALLNDALNFRYGGFKNEY